MTKKRLSIIFTGGTISMTHASGDGRAVPTLSASDICETVPGLSDFTVNVVEHSRIPGPHMGLNEMLGIHHAVEKEWAAGATGVVVTHGTDTLEETAFFLDLLHPGNGVIACVGAMRTKDQLSWDGPVNLYGGCLTASTPALQGYGAVVVMNNTINAASEVTKTYTQAVDTFVSPDMGPLGILDAGQVVPYHPPARRVGLPPPTLPFPRIELIYAAAGGDGALVDAALDAGAQGLVIAGLGRGNLPPSMATRVIAATDAGIPVVLTTRCWGGRVAAVYGYEGAGSVLQDHGVIFAPWYTPGKARIALALALAGGYGRARLGEVFGGD